VLADVTRCVAVETLHGAIRQPKGGTPVVDLCRKLELLEETFHCWNKRFGALGVSALQQLRQLREESCNLTQFASNVSFSKRLLQESMREMVAAAASPSEVQRSPATCRTQKAPRMALGVRLNELRAVRVGGGSPQPCVLLRREGRLVDPTFVKPPHQDRELQLRRKLPPSATKCRSTGSSRARPGTR